MSMQDASWKKAGMERAGQQARWLLWQMGSVAVAGAEPVHMQPAQGSAPSADFSHRRYDAVISRMKQAGQRTGAYTSWA